VKLPSNRRRPRGLPDIAWNPWADLRRRADVRGLDVSFPYGPMPDDFARSASVVACSVWN